MQTAETFKVARDAARAIADKGNATRVRVVGLSGASGGREENPSMFWAHAVRYRTENNGDCVMLWPGADLRDPERATFVVDGVGMYVAGWRSADGMGHSRAEDGYLLLHPIESGQVLLPRRAYVLRSAGISALNGEAY